MTKALPVAIVQAAPIPLAIGDGITKAVELAGEAIKQGAKLVAFGETFLGGYPLWLDEAPGAALLQTYQPEHPVIRAILAGEEEAFWAAEAGERRQAGVPPYGRMAGIILSGSDAAAVFDLGNHLARHDAPLRAVGAQVFGPAPAPIARVRGRHRVRLLVKADKGVALQEALSKWVGSLRLKGDLRLAVDIDPQSFY